MCLIILVALLGPRGAMFLWWLVDMDRWRSAFDTIIWPIAGFLILPWTTLAYVLVVPNGTISGFDWLWLAIGLIIDLASYGGSGGYEMSRRSGRTPTSRRKR